MPTVSMGSIKNKLIISVIIYQLHVWINTIESVSKEAKNYWKWY